MTQIAGTAKAGEKVPVRREAVIARLSRQLAKRGARLIVSRSPLVRSAAGEAFIIDEADGHVLTKHVDVMREAARLGALRAWETVVDDESDGEVA
jgi:hypothetical protein